MKQKYINPHKTLKIKNKIKKKNGYDSTTKTQTSSKSNIPGYKMPNKIF